MKFVVLLGLVGLFGHCVDAMCTGDEFNKVQQECLVANGGDKNMLVRFYKLEKANNNDEKCFRFCALNRCGYMDASGNVVANAIKDYLETFSQGNTAVAKSITDAFSLCEKTKPSPDKCTTASDYMDCLSKSCKGCVFDLGRQLSG